jgi:hypothetical protein
MILSQTEENKNKMISIGISLLIFALLLLFFYSLYHYYSQILLSLLAPGGGGGIEFNIGNLIEGTGNVDNGIGDAVKV